MTGAPRRWPLALIGAPAAVAVWSGWVGLGTLAGFGVVHPLPGILPGVQLNTAITLPVGVEAYGAYALGAWLSQGATAAARKFAGRSAIGALALGMVGQIAYHLLAAAHATRAPWPVVTLVSCLPVAALAFGTALAHLLRVDPDAPAEPAPDVRTELAAPPLAARTEAPPDPDGVQTSGRLDAAPPRTDPDPDPLADVITGAQAAQARRAGADATRSALVADMAGKIMAARAGEPWRPDYPALMAATGYGRSWAEKAVRDARTAARELAARTGQARTAEPVPA